MRPLALALFSVPVALYANPVSASKPLSYKRLSDPAHEARAQALVHTICWVVCQWQSIADRDADLAEDMYAIIRQPVPAGDTPEAIRAWLIARHGHWVNCEMPVEATTWPLWATPVLFTTIGLLLTSGIMRRRQAS